MLLDGAPSWRQGRWPQPVNEAQDLSEQGSRDGDLGQLESDIAAVVDHLGADLDQLFVQRSLPPRAALMSLKGHNRKSVTAARMSAFGGKAEVDFRRLDVCS